jgi:transcriptional regulator with XRE-family HTH domain
MPDSTSDANESFAAHVAHLQLSRGWSVTELAERSRLDRSEVESILRGEHEVQLDAVLLLARAFGISPGALVDGNVDGSSDG